MTRFRSLHACRSYGPGLITGVTLALAATFVSERHGGPQLLYALLFGIAFNFLAKNAATKPGLECASRALLRVGVALLGARITFEEIASIGSKPILIVILAVILTIVVGAGLARALKQPLAEGLLTGGAVAICGASAALAISAVLPRTARSEQFTVLTVVGVTLMSTAAMILYPLIVRITHLDAGAAGIFIGGTIHDVAQVIGAGYTLSTTTGDTATFVKLLRVAMLLPVICAFALIFRRAASNRLLAQAAIPWFLVVFAFLMAVASSGWISERVIAHLSFISQWCLVIAIAALGVKTSFQDFSQLGWRPILMLSAETVFLAGFVLLALWVSRLGL